MWTWLGEAIGLAEDMAWRVEGQKHEMRLGVQKMIGVLASPFS